MRDAGRATARAMAVTRGRAGLLTTRIRVRMTGHYANLSPFAAPTSPPTHLHPNRNPFQGVGSGFFSARWWSRIVAC